MQFVVELSTLQTIKFVMLLVFLFGAIVLVLYNWIYLIRVLTASKETDLHPPKNIGRLVKASIFTALFSAILILGFLLFRVY